MTLNLEDLRVKYDSEIDKYRRANRRLNDLISHLLDDLSESRGIRVGSIVAGSPKSLESLYAKGVMNGIETPDECFDRIDDIARARVVCHTIEDCRRLMALLGEQSAVYVDPLSVRDRIDDPSDTGYRAVHMVVTVDTDFLGDTIGVRCELQIRTALQEAWGHFTHDDFYKNTGLPELVRDLMRELSDLLYYADRQADLLVKEVLKVADAATTEPDETAGPEE